VKDSQIEIYHFEGGDAEIMVCLDEDTVWLSQKQMSALFGNDTDTIGLHIKNIFKSGELCESSTNEFSSVVQKEGKSHVVRKVEHYNLDVILKLYFPIFIAIFENSFLNRQVQALESIWKRLKLLSMIRQ